MTEDELAVKQTKYNDAIDCDKLDNLRGGYFDDELCSQVQDVYDTYPGSEYDELNYSDPNEWISAICQIAIAYTIGRNQVVNISRPDEYQLSDLEFFVFFAYCTAKEYFKHHYMKRHNGETDYDPYILRAIFYHILENMAAYSDNFGEQFPQPTDSTRSAGTR